MAAAIAEHVDLEGVAWPSADRLAGITGFGLRTVRARLKMLEDRGWFVVVERGGRAGGPRTSVIRITLPPTMTRAGDARVLDPTRAGDAPVTRAGDARVQDPTRASGATTRASHSTTRAGDAPELEELEEQDTPRQRQAVADALGWLQVERAAETGRQVRNRRAYAETVALNLLGDPAQCSAIDAAIRAAGPTAEPAEIASTIDHGLGTSPEPSQAPRLPPADLGRLTADQRPSKAEAVLHIEGARAQLAHGSAS